MFQTSYTFKDGLLHPGDNPGSASSTTSPRGSFEYTPAYLPVNRLQLDGTMHDW